VPQPGAGRRGGEVCCGARVGVEEHLVGAAQSGIQMASINLVYEFAEHGELGVRIAVVNAIGELFGAVAPLAGGAIADRWSYRSLYVSAMMFTVLALASMFRGVRPRHRR
jgi:MFS family permease